MRVLATGASGFLGRAVVRALHDAGHEVRTLQRRPSGVAGADDRLGSVTDPDAVASALDGIDGVVHLAAKAAGCAGIVLGKALLEGHLHLEEALAC